MAGAPIGSFNGIGSGYATPTGTVNPGAIGATSGQDLNQVPFNNTTVGIFTSPSAFNASLTPGIEAVGLVNGVLYTSANGVTSSAVGGGSAFLSLTAGNNLAAAQANAATIQNSLNGQGLISFPPGIYYVYLNGTSLTAYSLSTIDLTGCHLIAYGSGNCTNMFQNANFNAAQLTITAVAYTNPATANPGNHRINAAFTLSAAPPASIVAGGYIEINGDSTTFANGIWLIDSVAGSIVNVKMFNGGYLPSNQSSLSWTAYAADYDIEFRNGIIDLNYSSGLITGSQTSYTEHGVCFNHIGNLTWNKTEIRDCSLYALCTAHTQTPVFDCVFANRLDGLKIYGPNYQGFLVKNIEGMTGDDNSAQTADSVPYNTRMPPNAGGSFWGGGVVTVNMAKWNSYSGTWALYPNGGISSQQGWWMYGTYTFNSTGAEVGDNNVNLPGASSSGFSIGNNNQGLPYAGGIDKVVANSIRGFINLDDNNGAASNTASPVSGLQILYVPSITINDWVCKSASQSATALGLGIKCDSLVLNQPNFDAAPSTSANNNMFCIVPKSYAVCNNIVVNNPHLAGNTNIQSNLLEAANLNGNLGQVIINNPTFNSSLGNARLLNNNYGFANTPTIIINDADFSNITNYPLTIGAGSFDIQFNGGKFNPSSPPFNFYGAGTITLTGGDVAETGTPNYFNSIGGTVKFKKWRRNAPATYLAPTTGGNVIASIKSGDEKIIVNPAATLATLNVAFPVPTASLDGETRTLQFTQAITLATIYNANLNGSGVSTIGSNITPSAMVANSFYVITVAGSGGATMPGASSTTNVGLVFQATGAGTNGSGGNVALLTGTTVAIPAGYQHEFTYNVTAGTWL